MNLRKAIQRKKRIAGVLAESYTKLRRANITPEGRPPLISSREILERIKEKSEEIIQLKVQIQKANLPILEDIYRLAELKSLVNEMRNINSLHDRRYDNSQALVYTICIDEIEQEAIIAELEKQIEVIQDRIESFNFRVHIDTNPS
jgi:hypothetical protein